MERLKFKIEIMKWSLTLMSALIVVVIAAQRYCKMPWLYVSLLDAQTKK